MAMNKIVTKLVLPLVLLALSSVSLAHGHDYAPCPCCVLETFSPELQDGADLDCVDAIVAWADQQIAIKREICYSEGLREYDTWSWNMWWCNQLYAPNNCFISPSCELKRSMCQDLSWLSLYHALSINEGQYHSAITSIKLTAQWQIDTYCY